MGEHDRPAGVSDEAVRAAGLMSEAFERVERARGALYDAHQLIGGADGSLDDVIDALQKADRPELADRVRELVGIDTLAGRWTFEIVEEFDAGFYARWRAAEGHVRDELTAGRRHVYEAELKAKRQSTP